MLILQYVFIRRNCNRYKYKIYYIDEWDLGPPNHGWQQILVLDKHNIPEGYYSSTDRPAKTSGCYIIFQRSAKSDWSGRIHFTRHGPPAEAQVG